MGRFYQTLQERVTVISSHLLFLTLELNRLEDAELERKLAAAPRWPAGAPGCATCACSARTSFPTSWKSCCMRRRSPAAPPGAGCSTRPSPACAVTVGDEELTVSAALNKLSDRDRAVREAAAKGVSAAFGGQVRLFSLITNTLAKDKEIIDTWRHYPRPGSAATAPTWSRTRWSMRW